MLTLIEAGNAEKAVEVMQAFNRDGPRLFIKGLPFMMNGEPPVEQIPFKWQIYREHPQLCYTLAAELMSKIDAQAYKQGEFLPSCQALAQEYGVSLITMRRTLELLNNICVTETLNGVGTRVLSGKSAGMPKLSSQSRRFLFCICRLCRLEPCPAMTLHTHSVFA